MRLLRFLPDETHYDFVGKRLIAFALSAALFVLTLGSLGVQGLNLGIDFAGGIAVLTTDGYASAEEAALAFSKSGAATACISSSDALYAEHAEATARALKAAGAKLVLMAGRPGDKEAALKAAGVDQFLFAGADAVATLKGLQEKLGIS